MRDWWTTAALTVAMAVLFTVIGVLVVREMLSAEHQEECTATYDIGPNGVVVTGADCLPDTE